MLSVVCLQVFVCGQVCCDCEGRLNTESVVLQGDMSSSNGKAVPVNISNLPKYSLFPGQVCIIKSLLCNVATIDICRFANTTHRNFR